MHWMQENYARHLMNVRRKCKRCAECEKIM